MSPRILLVDDDPSVRAALGRVLQDLGHPVTAAGDGEQGLAELQRGSFDLLILDLDLPRLGGIEILRRIRTAWPLLPVVILSGLLGRCPAGDLAAADACLEKPPEVPALLKIISALLQETPEQRMRRARARRAGAAPAVLR